MKGRGFRQLPTKDKSFENISMNSNDYIAFDSSNAMIRELKRKWREYEEKVRKRSAVNILYFHMTLIDVYSTFNFSFQVKRRTKNRGKHRINVS